jgi:peptidoglycan hydrolase-like protein with peptidoglycan-binding domain
VDNQTDVPLTLVDQGHDRGDFMSLPQREVAPGGKLSCVSVETPRAKEQGCKGFLVFEVGSPAVATWRVEWDNPEEAKNSTNMSLVPQDAGFKTLDQIGQGEENVPVVFTISGGGGDKPPDKPDEKDPEFRQPPPTRQPTLRMGDTSADGWVEYLQEALNHHKVATLKVDGKFGKATRDAVVAFQTKMGLQVDGTVGNETWSVLRGGVKEAVGTDQRQPHTFKEKGAEARWDEEHLEAIYDKGADELRILCVSVGDASIEKGKATVRVTPPGAKSKVRVVEVVVGAPDQESSTGAGHQHSVKLKPFLKQFPALGADGKKDPKAKVTGYKVEAFFDAELGGDSWNGPIKEK